MLQLQFERDELLMVREIRGIKKYVGALIWLLVELTCSTETRTAEDLAVSATRPTLTQRHLTNTTLCYGIQMTTFCTGRPEDETDII